MEMQSNSKLVGTSLRACALHTSNSADFPLPTCDPPTRCKPLYSPQNQYPLENLPHSGESGGWFQIGALVLGTGRVTSSIPNTSVICVCNAHARSDAPTHGGGGRGLGVGCPFPVSHFAFPIFTPCSGANDAPPHGATGSPPLDRGSMRYADSI